MLELNENCCFLKFTSTFFCCIIVQVYLAHIFCYNTLSQYYKKLTSVNIHTNKEYNKPTYSVITAVVNYIRCCGDCVLTKCIFAWTSKKNIILICLPLSKTYQYALFGCVYMYMYSQSILWDLATNFLPL